MLVPLFSLRTSPHSGLGEIPDLVPFATWARAAGFRIVQVLPVNEILGGETSPYSAASAFALDPVYLSLDACEDFHAVGGRAVLSDPDRARSDDAAAAPGVRWHDVRVVKAAALRAAFTHFRDRELHSGSARARAFGDFSAASAGWLDDYALFAALHDRHRASWRDWPAALRDRTPAALAAARAELSDDILHKTWLQWQLDQQWRAARAACTGLGVDLMGDLPFVVAGDSADVWARRDDFRVDLRVGTPPDAFSETGQDWGLPVYNWDAMAENHYAWMRARAARAGELYGLYRVDHVIGLYRTFFRSEHTTEFGFTPADEDDQKYNGEAVLRILQSAGEVIAEDLGMVPDFLRPSLARLHIPGYRVLRWEKDDELFRDPATWPALSLATNGTHDLESSADWWDALPASEREALLAIPGLSHLDMTAPFDGAVRDALLRVLYASPSKLTVVPLQDALGTRERINVPGTVSAANWTWRLRDPIAALQADGATTARLARLAADTGR